MPMLTNDASKGPWLGIDFGTSNSSAARLINGQPLAIREPTTSIPLFPSCVLLRPAGSAPAARRPTTEVDGRLLAGVTAQRMRGQFPARFQEAMKRYLGQEWPLRMGDEALPVEVAVSAIIRAVKAEADRAVTKPYAAAVITVPVDFSGMRIARIERAAQAAGFAQVVQLREPEAAALYHAAVRVDEPTQRDELILVYDFGGGTFDAALVQVEHAAREAVGTHCETIAFAGISTCGGMDIDHEIFSALKEQASPALRADLEEPLLGPGTDGDASAIAALCTQLMAMDACRRMKHDLSISDVAVADFGSPPQTLTLTRAAFNALAAPFVESTLRCCDELVERAGKGWDAVDRILLVGGSSWIPLVSERLQRRFGRPIVSVADPELAVSLGAALFTQTFRVPAPQPDRPVVRVVDAAAGPYRSIQAALDAAAPGDTIRVRPGTYREALHMTKDVTLVGEGSRSQLVVESDGTAALTIDAARGRVSGLTFQSTNTESTLFMKTGDVLVESCEITGGTAASIGIEGGAPTLRGNRVHDAVQLGILAYNGAKPIIEYNEIVKSEIACAGWSRGTELVARGNRIQEAAFGISLAQGAHGTLEGNEISASNAAGIQIGDEDTDAIVRANRIHDGKNVAISVNSGAHCTIEENILEENLAGILINDDATSASVRGNRIVCLNHENEDFFPYGISVGDGASATIEENDIENASRSIGIGVGQRVTGAVVRANRIRRGGGVLVSELGHALIEGNEIAQADSGAITIRGDGAEATIAQNTIRESQRAGILVAEGANATITDNDIAQSQTAGIVVADAGSGAAIRSNRIHDGENAGIFVHSGACARIEGNEIAKNQVGIGVKEQGQRLTIKRNRIVDNKDGAYSFDQARSGYEFAANDLGLREQGGTVLKNLIALLETAELTRADAESIRLIRQWAGHQRVDDAAKAAALPPQQLKAMDGLWRLATGGGLLSRGWCTADDLTAATSWGWVSGETWLRKRLRDVGCAG